MEVTLKELKIQPGRIIAAASGGVEVTVTVRGVPAAKIVPFKVPAPKTGFDTSAFGIWAGRDDMEDVDVFVRNIRKGRGQ